MPSACHVSAPTRLQIDAAARAAAATTPRFIKDADALASSLGRLSSSALSSLFGVSAAIGTLNEGRFNSWSNALDGLQGVAAGVAMDGPAFKALDIRSLSPSEAESAAKRGNAAGLAAHTHITHHTSHITHHT
jgi:cytoplasmic iron level regulating protein YaaA (DUF328/UPF0246 family)